MPRRHQRVAILPNRRSAVVGECLRELFQVVWPGRRSIARALRAAMGSAVIVTTFVAGLNVGFEHGVASLIR